MSTPREKHRPGGATVWSTTCLSRRNTTRSAQAQVRLVGDDDTRDAAMAAARRRRMTASPLTESRAPVGSSASVPALADDRPGDRDTALAARQLIRVPVGACHVEPAIVSVR